MNLGYALPALALSTALLGACASEPRTPFTESDEMTAVAIGAPNIRYWADATASVIQGVARHAVVQKGRPFVYLALSGGGGSGAFGAGVLNGWSVSGTRPEFTIVSGVSTGALIAPFAFLGPDYDDRLRQVYTDGEAQRLIGEPNPLGALFGPGAFGRERLRRLVERHLDDDLIRAIAREDQKGRRLLVVTTNLDAQRAVVWDMGAIAASGEPKAFELFREVLAASASVPVVFAPQLIDVEANDRVFQEMHADGTLSAPVYTLPDAMLFGGKPILRAARPALYVIVNGRIDPGFAVVPDQAGAIAAQSLSTLNRVGTKAVLAQTYNVATREGLSFHLTYVDRDHRDSGGTGFETDAMRQLYDYGYAKARSGAFWVTDLSQVEAAKDEAKAVAAPVIR
ncbi:MAG: patatin-like phospholipase family protein [Roseiarcus sp.]